MKLIALTIALLTVQAAAHNCKHEHTHSWMHHNNNRLAPAPQMIYIVPGGRYTTPRRQCMPTPPPTRRYVTKDVYFEGAFKKIVTTTKVVEFVPNW